MFTEDKVKRQRSTPSAIAFAVLLLASLACSFLTSAPGTSAPPPVDPQQVVPSPQQEQPTEVPPTAVPPTEAPSPTPASQKFFTEEFENNIDNWEPFTVNGSLSQLDLSTQDGRLAFDLNDKQLWTYVAYTPETYDDVRIEVQVENFGDNENNITLFCRYDEEDGWYEFNVANSGLYWIYYGRWNANGSGASYAVVADGGSNNIKQGFAINTYSLSCKGNTITVYINDKELKHVDDSRLRKGQIGIGVSSFRRLPVKVEFDWVKITEP